MTVILITGGKSSEREVSLTSASEVKKALEELGIKVILYDLKRGLLGIKKLIDRIDIIFPVIHGEEGEGGKLHRFLSSLNKPFIGGDWRGYKKSWYKTSFKRFCKQNNILTAPWKSLSRLNRNHIVDFGFPSVLKTDNGGSSKEVAVIKKILDLEDECVMRILTSGQKLFIEKFIEGVEVTVGILNNQPLPVIEIIPPNGSWFDFENKYSGKSLEIPFAPSLDKKIQIQTQGIALKIHKSLNLGHMSRTDFIVSDNKIYALEVNTIPGLTSQSLFPKAAAAAGINFNQLVQMLLNTYLE